MGMLIILEWVSERYKKVGNVFEKHLSDRQISEYCTESLPKKNFVKNKNT